MAAGYSRDRETAEAFVGKLTREGLKGSIHQGNIGSAEDCRRTVNEVIEQHGRLDILVNNAGITIDKTVLKMTDEDWYKVIAVNLSGAFFMSQAVLPHMIERGSGRIVNISSIIGEMGNIGQANYAASKSGLFGLTKTLAREAAFQLKRAGKLEEDGIGITVNTVAPGFIATEMLETSPKRCSRASRRRSRSDDWAGPTRSLASCTSSWATSPRSSPGRSWSVNGGMDM